MKGINGKEIIVERIIQDFQDFGDHLINFILQVVFCLHSNIFLLHLSINLVKIMRIFVLIFTVCIHYSALLTVEINLSLFVRSLGTNLLILKFILMNLEDHFQIKSFMVHFVILNFVHHRLRIQITIMKENRMRIIKF